MNQTIITQLSNGMAVAKGNIYSSVSVAHWNLTHTYGPSDVTVRRACQATEAHWMYNKYCGSPVVSKMQPAFTGYFVDWEGVIRKVEAPGDGYNCHYYFSTAPFVEVINQSGEVIFTGDYHPHIESIERALAA